MRHADTGTGVTPDGFSAALSRFDREGMLRSIEKLAKATDTEEMSVAAFNRNTHGDPYHSRKEN
jgi:N-methylhydantoinase B/oxoprolinase/acetone carboxylase alpha subunit